MKLKTYTPEFRAEEVKLVLEQGLSQEQAAQWIEVPKGTLANWVSAAKRSTDPAALPGSRSVAELETELAKLRKELAVERMEKEVLKRSPRTLRGSRCPVRVHEDGATQVSAWPVVPCL
ncbi:transposase [Massilia forsythiae]|uniref:Transposase n=1 Tax=Massilia forsythiae TaxID=2728020 RepID=A0A7Z2VYJ7_9BURK|nr:transposase [Massilia forsythiae]